MGQLDNQEKGLSKKYLELLNKKESNENILKYCDPNFPKNEVVLGVDNTEMADYAKTHLPVPILQNSGNPEFDKAKYESDLFEWGRLNTYYPQFIPYHLFDRLLTPEDDIKFYEAAVKIWIANNPEKFEDISSFEN
ncbi:MAG: hypothetical protein CVU05_02965 [Bacteroidetes bacterium HGW-Bacteroidetes-21]|nr:MAG: hypothetical protein CVU05_02965 [Bacteroidetes bacterium HGW-Bacteroidetes-21]